MFDDSSKIKKFLAHGTTWSIIGTILTLILFLWQKHNDSFKFSITINDEFDLVEIRERIDDLKILFHNEDILDGNKSIKVVWFTLQNKGQTILNNHYENTQPFGLYFEGAVILNAEIVDSNASLLKDNILCDNHFNQNIFNMETTNTMSGILNLKKMIFEKNKYVKLKVFLLQKQGRVSVRQIGKIADIDEIEIQREKKITEKDSLNILNAIMGISFMVTVGIALSVFIASIIELMKLHAIKVKRKKIRRFCEAYNHKIEIAHQKIIEYYKRRWNCGLTKLLNILTCDSAEINLSAYRLSEVNKKKDLFPFSIISTSSILRKLSNLPEEIFEINGDLISLNKANQEFIITFFTEMGVLEKNKHLTIDIQ